MMSNPFVFGVPVEGANFADPGTLEAGVVLNNGLTRVYSTDTHFDEIKGIERIDPIDLSLNTGVK